MRINNQIIPAAWCPYSLLTYFEESRTQNSSRDCVSVLYWIALAHRQLPPCIIWSVSKQMDHTAAAGFGRSDRHSRCDTIRGSVYNGQSSQTGPCKLNCHIRHLQTEPEPDVSRDAVYSPGCCSGVWSSSWATRSAFLRMVYESLPDYPWGKCDGRKIWWSISKLYGKCETLDLTCNFSLGP